VLLLSSAMASACGDAAATARAEALDQGRAVLAEDASRALFLARGALTEHGADARLSLLAAEACLALDRRNDALVHAEQGLSHEGLDEALAADLHYARGRSLMGRFKDLAAEADFRDANVALESATRSGSHRAEAATLLVGLQDLHGHRNDERQLKFARLLFQLEPDGAAAVKVRAMLAARGLEP
jgi:hypothetical protein